MKRQPPPKRRAPLTARRARPPSERRPSQRGTSRGRSAWLFWRWVLLGFVGVGLLGVASLGAGWAYLRHRLPEPSGLENPSYSLPTQIYDRHGEQVAQVFIQRRKLVRYETLPPTLIDALIAKEDNRFFDHIGIDVVRMIKAAWVNLISFSKAQGASSLTQQTARQFFLDLDKTWERKLSEIVLALEIERRFSKKEIIELYLNKVNFGDAWGVAAASEVYFAKPVEELTLPEAAMLIGLLPAPNRYKPTKNPRLARQQRDVVLKRMWEEGYLSEAAYREAIATPLRIASPDADDEEASAYYVELVRRELLARYGSKALYEGGLRVYTALDRTYQRAAARALRHGVEAVDRRQGYRGAPRQLDLQALLKDDLPAREQRQGGQRQGESIQNAPPSANAPLAPEEVLRALDASMAATPVIHAAQANSETESPSASGSVALAGEALSSPESLLALHQTLTDLNPAGALAMEGPVEAIVWQVQERELRLALSPRLFVSLDWKTYQEAWPLLQKTVQQPAQQAQLRSLIAAAESASGIHPHPEPAPTSSTDPEVIARYLGLAHGNGYQTLVDVQTTVQPQHFADIFQRGQIVLVRREKNPAASAPATSDAAAAQDLSVWQIYQHPQANGGVYASDPQSGEVLALVGGVRFGKHAHESEFIRATQALRQPGSGFKPIVYAAALEQNYHPASVLADVPRVFTLLSGVKHTPRNYDQRYLGPVSLREALVRSRNVPTVQLAEALGPRQIINYARRLGIETPIPEEVLIALGTHSMKLSELTRAYGVFAAGGRKAQPIYIRRIEDDQGQVIFEAEHVSEQVIPAATAYLISDVLSDVVRSPRGTAHRALKGLNRPIAAKTGTTQDYASAWFIGYVPRLVAGVYVGFDDARRSLGPHEGGSRVAAPIWREFFEAIAERTPAEPFARPESIVSYRIDRQGSLLDPCQRSVAATEESQAHFELFRADTVARHLRRSEEGCRSTWSSSAEGGTTPALPRLPSLEENDPTAAAPEEELDL